MSATGRHWFRRALQVAGLGAACWYLVRTASAHRAELLAVPLEFHAVPFLLASLLTVATWFLLVRSWSRSLRWWSEELPLAAAVRIWFITNLSRFVPGAVWQFAHVSAEALSARISPLAATGAILFQQLVLLGTGLALTASLAPVLPTAALGTLHPLAALGLASLGVAAVIIFLPVLAPVLERWTSRLLKRDIRWPSPARAELTRYVGVLVLPWLAYGVAFWLFGRALLGECGAGAPPGGRRLHRQLRCGHHRGLRAGRPRRQGSGHGCAAVAGRRPGPRAAPGHRLAALARRARDSHRPRRARLAPRTRLPVGVT